MPEAQPIIQYWHDDDVPSYVVEAAASFDEHNPDLPHLIFDESTAAALIEEHFGARELAAFRSCAVPAMQSDYFRYCAVFALGGVYVDVDFGCKTPLHGLLEEAEGQLFRLPTGPLTSSCFAFRAARHPFLRVAIDVATANVEHGPMESGETATGAMIFTGLILLHELGSIDAFSRVCGSAVDQWRPRLMTDAIGGYERLAQALRGVQLNGLGKLYSYCANREIGHVGRKRWEPWQSVKFTARPGQRGEANRATPSAGHGESGHPPILGYWHHRLEPVDLKKISAPYRRHNPGSSHLIFDESTAAALIEEHFGARELAAFRSCAVPAMQSDYFRYCAVFALGGVYVDVDFGCAASFDPLLDEADAQLFLLSKVAHVMNGFFAVSSPRHPLLRLAVDVATAGIEARSPEPITHVTGPQVFTGLWTLRRLGSIDAFLKLAAIGRPKTLPWVISEAVGNYERIAQAFENVTVNPISRVAHYLVRRDCDLPEGMDWTKWNAGNYRTPRL